MMKSKFMVMVLCMVLLSKVVYTQTRDVTGLVTTSDGETLPGVTVLVVGTSRGGITDLEGKFSIQAAPDDYLQFSYIGFENKVIPVGVSTELQVELELKDEVLEEVVVVGYGLQKKESIVASIVQTTGEELERTGGVPSLSNALTGLLPGITTIQNSGEPGDDNATIYIRGRSSWNGGEPLYIVDGVKVDNINNIEPTEVQSISVLKDATATAVFGVEGAEGVILVTTKRGQHGKPKLTFQGSTRVKTLSRIPTYLNSYEALSLRNRAIEHEISTTDRYWDYYMPQEKLDYYRTQEYPYLYPDVDWSEHMIEDYALSHKLNFNVSGGTKFVKYFASLAYIHDGDIIKTHDYGQGYDPDFSYDRFNFRTNLDFQITKSTVLKVNLSGYHGVKQEMKSNASTSFWQGVYGAPPDLYPVRYENGWFGYNEFYQDEVNPVAELNFGGYIRKNTTQVLSDFDLVQKLDFITKGLSVKGKFSYQNVFQTRGPDMDDQGIYTMYIDPSILDAQNAADSNAAIYTRAPYEAGSDQTGYDYVRNPLSVSSESGFKSGDQVLKNLDVKRHLVYQFSLNYNRSFAKHNVSVLALMKREENANKQNWPAKREDWVGRFTYNYDKRYFLEFNGAYNGTDKFGPDYRFGFFPSTSVGWMISNEPFVKDRLTWLSMLKVRYSNGKVGNDKVKDASNKGLYQDSWTQGGTASLGYPVWRSSYKYWKQNVIGVEDIQWATAHKQNAGVDFAFYSNMLSFSYDYFWEHRTNIFMEGDKRTMLPWFGAEPVAGNIGETKTKGWEMYGKFKKQLSKGLYFWLDASYSHSKDEIIKYEDAENKPDYQKNEGFQIEQTRTRITEDLMNNWNDVYTSILGEGEDIEYVLPGDFRYIDFNSDGVINDLDIVPYGYPSRPQRNYNFSFGTEFKGVSAMVQFYGVHNISRSIRLPEFSKGNSVARPFHADDSWTPQTAESATYPHVRYEASANYGSYWIKDASYLRLKTIELAYNMTFEALKKRGVSNIRVFFNGNNLYLWSKMLEDREGGSYEKTNYPMTVSYNLGLTVNF